VLFRLDRSPFETALRRAEAELGTIRTELLNLEASYRQKQAEIAGAEADVEFYSRDFERYSSLAANNVAAKAQLDRARHDLQTARERQEALRRELDGIAASLGGDPDAPVEQHPRYRVALADVADARRNLDHAEVRAPLPGVVANVESLQPGSWLAAGAPAFSLVSTESLWIEASPKETQLTDVRAGQPVRMTVDTYPGQAWGGRVTSISPASGSEFAVLPAQNTSGNWVKVVQRIPVRIEVEPAAGQPPLRAGMSVEVAIDTGRQRSLASLSGDLLGGLLGGSAYGHDSRGTAATGRDPSGLYAGAAARDGQPTEGGAGLR
jgi:membrane fusion protein (multidrug efflux system)